MGQSLEKLANTNVLGGIVSVMKTDTEYIIHYDTGEQAYLNILNNHVFRFYMSPNGELLDYPKQYYKTKVNSKKLSSYDKTVFKESKLEMYSNSYSINTDRVHILFDKEKGTMTVYDETVRREVIYEVEPLCYDDNKTTQTLRQRKDEYFYGCGLQNGTFSHKGESIKIINTNNWSDGGITSPCPFYWSTYGYGVLRNTSQPGIYDFGVNSPDIVKTFHIGEDYDAFFFINPLPKDILNDYYELTGRPILMPEYAFYQAHLNTFSRDYWVKVNPNIPGAILYEDGNYYKNYKPSKLRYQKGISETLNGEKNNYQFSARAMIDRYKKYDMPLGWYVPDDGYGAGLTNSSESDVLNLKNFADYSKANGVETVLWTETSTSSYDPNNSKKKKECDLIKDIGSAGVVALRYDVARITSGYSFGINAAENNGNISVSSTKHGIRPMIVMVNGWANTQWYSNFWGGDEVGGLWEYIRYYIPSYIGSGLSGQPVIGSDMDAIHRGKNREVNIRDYQWKTFTPLQLNVDVSGHIPKAPFTLDEEATEIKRAYLKLKSILMPYNYTLGYESIHGLPMLRAMFLEFPEEPAAHTNSQYQFMWGPSILVAPIYSAKGVIDASLRNGIYLPNSNQVWIDFFTGQKYQGGKIYNSMLFPLWKIPIFIKDGAIIPTTIPNNNPYEIERDRRYLTFYPNGRTDFNLYEDDGISSDYLEGHYATTKIKVKAPPSNKHGDLFINIHKTEGSYKNMVKERITILQIMASKDIDRIKVSIGGEIIKMSEIRSDEAFHKNVNVYYLKNDFVINPYFTRLREVWKQKCLLVKIQTTDVTKNEIHIKFGSYANESKIYGNVSRINKYLKAPTHVLALTEENLTTITLIWQPETDAICYEIEKNDVIFTNVIGTAYAFEDLKYGSEHSFRIRSVNYEGVSDWSFFVTVVIKKYNDQVTSRPTYSVPGELGQVKTQEVI